MADEDYNSKIDDLNEKVRDPNGKIVIDSLTGKPLVKFSTGHREGIDMNNRGHSATTKEIGSAFGKNTKWAYKILSSLEDAFRISCGTGHHCSWWIP